MLILANIAGFLYAKRQVLAIVLGGILLVIVLFAVGMRIYHVFNPPAKLDEKQIQKAQTAIAEQDRKVMVEILAESDTRVEQVDSNIKLIDQARETAKQSYADKSNQELADELNRRAEER